MRRERKASKTAGSVMLRTGAGEGVMKTGCALMTGGGSGRGSDAGAVGVSGPAVAEDSTSPSYVGESTPSESDKTDARWCRRGGAGARRRWGAGAPPSSVGSLSSSDLQRGRQCSVIGTRRRASARVVGWGLGRARMLARRALRVLRFSRRRRRRAFTVHRKGGCDPKSRWRR